LGALRGGRESELMRFGMPSRVRKKDKSMRTWVVAQLNELVANGQFEEVTRDG
jgi:hypothetical protein